MYLRTSTKNGALRMRTVREIAEDIGVSPRAILSKIKRETGDLPRGYNKNSRVTPGQEKKIREWFKTDVNNARSHQLRLIKRVAILFVIAVVVIYVGIRALKQNETIGHSNSSPQRLKTTGTGSTSTQQEKTNVTQRTFDSGQHKQGNIRTNSIGMKLVWIPPGDFDMGSDEGISNENERPVHPVRISKGFWMGRTEVTRGQYKAVMNARPWSGQKNVNVQESDNYPAEYVRWNDAVNFCRKLSIREGGTYRLPTEAEWEYACRAGTKTAYSFGDSQLSLGEYAWFEENAYDIGEEYAHPVAQKKPNAFGLYDMHGNVWEWCSDWYNKDCYSNSPNADPMGPDTGSSRVFRGGSWYFKSRNCRSVSRSGFSPMLTFMSSGFRIVAQDFSAP